MGRIDVVGVVFLRGGHEVDVLELRPDDQCSGSGGGGFVVESGEGGLLDSRSTAWVPKNPRLSEPWGSLSINRTRCPCLANAPAK